MYQCPYLFAYDHSFQVSYRIHIECYNREVVLLAHAGSSEIHYFDPTFQYFVLGDAIELRSRWLAKDGTSIILKHEALTWAGISYSKEFADVSKKIFGHIPDTCSFSGAVL